MLWDGIDGYYFSIVNEIKHYGWINNSCSYINSEYSLYVEEITNKYFGVKFLLNGNYHYGWIKFKKSYGTNISIISFAYNTQPNQYLKIEDPNPSSGIEDIVEDEISIYPNPIDNILNIESNYIIKEYSIIDINGKTLLNSKINDKNITIKTDYISKGVYIVKLELNDKIIIKKVIK